MGAQLEDDPDLDLDPDLDPDPDREHPDPGRDQSLRQAKSACLNWAEGAGRVTRADKARVFAIARGEAVEAAAACGSASEVDVERVAVLADKLVGMLTRLIR